MNNDSKKTLKIVLISVASVIAGMLLIRALIPVVVVMLIRGGDHVIHEFVWTTGTCGPQGRFYWFEIY